MDKTTTIPTWFGLLMIAVYWTVMAGMIIHGCESSRDYKPGARSTQGFDSPHLHHPGGATASIGSVKLV